MLVKDILWSARFDYLDDAGDIKSASEWFSTSHNGCLWPDDALLRHLNTSLNEWCKETGCLRDHITEAICKIPILCNQHTYKMDSRITEVHKGYLDKEGPQVYPKSDEWLDNNIPMWKRLTGSVLFLLPDYDMGYLRMIYYPGSTLGYWSGAVGFTALTKTIAKTGGLFSTLLIAGDQVVVSGTTSNGTTASPRTFTVATVSSDSFTVIETVTGESAPAAIIQKVIDTLWMTVSRLPLNQLTIGGVETETPEIRSDYHSYLVHGICREAYSKQDSQTLDVNKSKDHEGKFEKYKMKARAERDWLRASEQTMKPHPGAL
jgi:hypothetical protein